MGPAAQLRSLKKGGTIQRRGRRPRRPQPQNHPPRRHRAQRPRARQHRELRPPQPTSRGHQGPHAQDARRQHGPSWHTRSLVGPALNAQEHGCPQPMEQAPPESPSPGKTSMEAAVGVGDDDDHHQQVTVVVAGYHPAMAARRTDEQRHEWGRRVCAAHVTHHPFPALELQGPSQEGCPSGLSTRHVGAGHPCIPPSREGCRRVDSSH